MGSTLRLTYIVIL